MTFEQQLQALADGHDGSTGLIVISEPLATWVESQSGPPIHYDENGTSYIDCVDLCAWVRGDTMTAETPQTKAKRGRGAKPKEEPETATTSAADETGEIDASYPPRNN